jgi:hypothetical protein
MYNSVTASTLWILSFGVSSTSQSTWTLWLWFFLLLSECTISEVLFLILNVLSSSWFNLLKRLSPVFKFDLFSFHLCFPFIISFLRNSVSLLNSHPCYLDLALIPSLHLYVYLNCFWGHWSVVKVRFWIP